MKKLMVTFITMGVALFAPVALFAQSQDPNYSTRVQDRKNVTPKQTCQSIHPLGTPSQGRSRQSPSAKPTRADGVN